MYKVPTRYKSASAIAVVGTLLALCKSMTRDKQIKLILQLSDVGYSSDEAVDELIALGIWGPETNRLCAIVYVHEVKVDDQFSRDVAWHDTDLLRRTRG